MSDFDSVHSGDHRAGEHQTGEPGQGTQAATKILGQSVHAWQMLIAQMMKYGIFGGLGALTDFVVYTVLVSYVGLAAVVANILSILSGIAVSFVLNSRLTFRRTDNRAIRATRFLAVGLTGLGLSTLMLAGLTGWAKMDPIWAKVITLPLIALFQFVVNKLWSFSPKLDKSNPPSEG